MSEHTSHWLVQTKCPYFFLALLLFHHFVCSSEIFVLIRQRSWPCMKENGFTSFRFYVTCHLDISDKKLNCQTMLKWMYTNVSYFSRYLGMLGITYLIDLMNTMSSNTLCLSNGTLSVVVYLLLFYKCIKKDIHNMIIIMLFDLKWWGLEDLSGFSPSPYSRLGCTSRCSLILGK